MILDKFRTFWRRFFAGLVDCLIFLPLGWIDEGVTRSTDQLTSLLWLSVSSSLFVTYSIWMHARRGQTLGKIVTGVRVLDVSESKLSFRQALFRDAVPAVLTIIWVAMLWSNPDLTLRALYGSDNQAAVELFAHPGFLVVGYFGLFWFCLELLTMLMNEKRRAVHDLIAGSVVVRSR